MSIEKVLTGKGQLPFPLIKKSLITEFARLGDQAFLLSSFF